MKAAQTALAVAPKADLAVERKQVSAIRLEADKIVVATDDDEIAAVSFLSRVKTLEKSIEAEKTKLVSPLNVALKAARALFAPLEAEVKTIETGIKGKLAAYVQERRQRIEAEKAKITARLEAGKIKQTTAERKLAAVAAVPTAVKVETGGVSYRKVRKVHIIDAALLPREYLVPDEVAIRRAALAGIAIPGVEVKEEDEIAAR